MPQSLNLSSVFNVSVTVASAAVAAPAFNQALIVGPSTVIPSQGATGRVRAYSSTSAMLTDGFQTSAPEYIAAGIYFGQSPAPTLLKVGRQDLTALYTVAVGSSAGTDYVVGDILTVSQAGASGGQVKVTTVGTGGVVTGIALVTGAQGTGYTVANGVSTTGGTGTGAQIDITAVGESPLQAMAACRIADPDWYAGIFVGTALDADHEAIAAFIEGASPLSTYFLTTSAAAVLNNTPGNLLAVLKAAQYRRTFSIYSTTQSGSFPGNAYAAAAPAGLAMGRNTGAAGSYFDIMFKTISGVGAEPLTQSQVDSICGSNDGVTPGLNGNAIVTYNNGAYTWLQRGVTAAGFFFDEVLNLDMLAAEIQTNVANLFTASNSVPFTEAGMNMVKTVIAQACAASQERGFIAPSGVWTGPTIGTGVNAIAKGQALPKGYAMYSPTVASQSAAARGARIMPTVTVVLVEAQSGHSLTVSVQVQR